MNAQNTTEIKAPPPKAPPMFLMGLDVQTTNLVLDAAKKQQVAANQIILHSGEKATRLYLMRRGRVRYYKPTRSGEEVLLTWLTPGDVFGLGTLLTNPPNYIGTAETITDSEMFVWEHLQIRKLARTYPQLAENSFRIILKYLQSYSEKHVSLITNTAEERLGQVMLDLAHRIGNVSPDGVEINALTNN
jgi:CRP-like cAMP-binding protein